jgi:hypothetical protein
VNRAGIVGGPIRWKDGSRADAGGEPTEGRPSLPGDKAGEDFKARVRRSAEQTLELPAEPRKNP